MFFFSSLFRLNNHSVVFVTFKVMECFKYFHKALNRIEVIIFIIDSFFLAYSQQVSF